MSTIADYQNRTIDLLAFTGQDPKRKTLLQQTLAKNGLGGEICTGTQKLAQRWLIEFLTATGSLTFLPNRGCDFMILLRTCQLRTTLDAEQAFFLGADQVSQNLRAEDADSDPQDETLAEAELISLTLGPDYLYIKVKVVSQAGDSRPLILPIPVTVTG